MAKQFKVGDKVQIKKSSQYYGDGDSSNPININGRVTCNSGSSDHNISVDWDNGSSNVYNEHDLKVIKELNIDTSLIDEIYYKDAGDDVLEVDTEISQEVFFRLGQGEGSEFESQEVTVMLTRKQVKKLRKQLKAWLDKNA